METEEAQYISPTKSSSLVTPLETTRRSSIQAQKQLDTSLKQAIILLNRNHITEAGVTSFDTKSLLTAIDEKVCISPEKKVSQKSAKAKTFSNRKVLNRNTIFDT